MALCRHLVVRSFFVEQMNNRGNERIQVGVLAILGFDVISPSVSEIHIVKHGSKERQMKELERVVSKKRLKTPFV